MLRQTDPDFELLIVENGSSDETLSVAQALFDPRVQVHFASPAGVSTARNVGTRAAAGQVVCFVDSDDLLLPHYLETVRAVFAQPPSVAFVYTDAWTFNDRTRRVRKQTTAHYQRPPRPAPQPPGELFSELLKRNFIIVPVAVQRDALEAVGGFDEAMAGAEDWDLWLRLLASGGRAREAPGPLGLRREHAGQASLDHLRMVNGAVRLFDKLLREQSLGAEDEAVARAQLARARSALRTATGADRRGALRRHLTLRLAAAKGAVGLGARWYRHPPEVVAAAFGDLSRV